mgnify:CR=1 FL=1
MNARWTPALLLVSVFNFAFSNPWVEWFGGAWGHFQGPVSAAFILSKDDVKQAVKDMFRCRCQVKDTKKNGRTSSSNRPGRTGSRLANSTRIWLTASKLRLSSTPGGSSHFSSDFQEDWPKSTVTVDEQHDAEQIVGDDIPEQQIGSSNNATPASSFMDEQLKLHNAEIANKEEEDDDDNDDDAGMEDDDSERMMTEFGAVISSRTTTAPQSDNHQDESSSKMEDEPDMEQALPEMQ